MHKNDVITIDDDNEDGNIEDNVDETDNEDDDEDNCDVSVRIKRKPKKLAEEIWQNIPEKTVQQLPEGVDGPSLFKVVQTSLNDHNLDRILKGGTK